MGAAASAASPPPEAVPPADPPAAKVDTHPTAAASPPPEAAAPADPPAKEVDTQSAAASPPAEAADPPAKEDVQPAATAADAPTPADSPAKEEIQPPAPAPAGDAEAEGETVVFDAAAEAGEEEEVGECPFCLYMKGGGCKDEFVVWEKCIEEAEQEGGDVVERCAQATTALRSCMDKFPDYYEPILRVERTMSEDLEAAKAEAEAEASQDSPASSPPAPPAEGEQGDSKKQPDEVVVPKEKEDPAAA